MVGTSGAGKSTLLRTVNLLERPQSGRILIDGRDITADAGPSVRRLRHGIGMVFQRFNLFTRRSVAANVEYPLRAAGVARAIRQARVRSLLDMVGLADRSTAWPQQLSGGQQQRVGIARALATEPAILLCDEPTSALDPETAGSIIRLLRDINRTLGVTLVVVSHAMDAVKDLCDRVAVMEHGRIVEVRPTIELFAHPRHLATQTLLRREAGFDVEQPNAADAVRMRVTIHGSCDSTRLLTATARRFSLDLAFEHGRISSIGGATLTQVVVRLPATAPVTAIMEHLRSAGARVETDHGP
jgi:D-methionine transport system ATP-binding protein